MASQKKKRLIDPKQRTIFGASGIIGLADANNNVLNNKTSVTDDTEKDKIANNPVKVVRNWNEKMAKIVQLVEIGGF
ncbi:MAG: hypothetical protein AB2693_27700 [Candidatus Thiodiazotropha sp.]